MTGQTVDRRAWRKARASLTGNCVEVRELDNGAIAIRDSKHPGGSVLEFTPAEWAAFLNGARNGEFDF